MTAESEPVAEVSYRVVESWGDRADTDAIWMAHAFPGQAYLSEVVAGGISPVTHVISVGSASDAGMCDWLAVRDPSSDWATYLAAARAVSDYVGAGQARTVKTWGASQADIAGK